MTNFKIKFDQPLVRAKLINYESAQSDRFLNASEDLHSDSANRNAHSVDAKHDSPSSHIDQESSLESQRVELCEQILFSFREFHNQWKQRLSDFQKLSIKVAVAIARRVTYSEIEENDSRVVSLVEKMIQQLNDHESIQIQLNEDDAKSLKPAQFNNESMPTNIEIWSDPKIARGECIVGTKNLELSSSLDEQFSEIESKLLEAIENATVERRGANDPNRLQRFPDRRQAN